MKVQLSVALRSLYWFLLLIGTISAVQGAQKNRFPDRVSPLYSKQWSVQYFNTYKIARNLAAKKTYLLYQKGTKPPSGRYDSVIEIPLTGKVVGLTETPPIAYMDLLGVSSRVKAFLGDKKYISSPCFLDRIDNGSIIHFTGNASSRSALSKAGINATSLITFAYTYDDIGAIVHKVYLSEYYEKSNQAVFEWIKFYSLFFNLENLANRLANETLSHVACIKSTAVKTQPKIHPVVLWAYYDSFANGWSVAKCPNYYCELAADCSATLVPAVNGSITSYGYNYLSDTEFLKFGKDATYWIYPSYDWNTIFTTKKSTLSQFKSVKSKHVFDNQGSGSNGWFEERLVDYDNVLADFCTIVGKNSNTKRKWLRNVFTESVGNLGKCSNITKVVKGTGCKA